MNRRSTQDDCLLRAALEELSQSSRSPDLSRSIMGRLGYMRVSPEVARRRSLLKWANRMGMIAIAGVALILGWRVFTSSPQIRRPIETTVPQAVSRDVQQQSQQLNSMIQTIRAISSPRFLPRLSQQHSPAGRLEGGHESPQGRGFVELQTAPGASASPATTETIDQGESIRREHSIPDIGPRELDDRYDRSLDHSQMQFQDEMNRGVWSPVRWA